MTFPTGWSYYKVGTIDHNYVGSTLTDFPLLARKASDSDINSHALGNGNDIRFSSDSGSPTEYPFGHVGSFSAGNLLEYLKVPSISAVVDTTFRVWYGNAGASDGQNKSGVPDSNTQLFMPLEEDPSGSFPQMLDWKSGTNVGTASGSMTSGDSVAGQVGNGLDFDGVDDSVSLGNYDMYSAGAWSYRLILSAGFGSPVIQSILSANRSLNLWADLRNNGSERLEAEANFGSAAATYYFPGGSYPTGLHQAAVTFDGSTMRLYWDGTQVATGSGTGLSPADSSITIGSGNWSNWDGTQDELQIDIATRSADYISFDYQNKFNNRVSWGGELSAGGGGGFIDKTSLILRHIYGAAP